MCNSCHDPRDVSFICGRCGEAHDTAKYLWSWLLKHRPLDLEVSSI